MKNKRTLEIPRIESCYWWHPHFSDLPIDEIIYKVRSNYSEYDYIRFYFKGSFYVITTKIYKEKVIEL